MSDPKKEALWKCYKLLLDKAAERTREKKPVIYFITHSEIPPGILLQFPPGRYIPEFIVIHPDDLEILSKSTLAVKLVHLHEFMGSGPGFEDYITIQQATEREDVPYSAYWLRKLADAGKLEKVERVGKTQRGFWLLHLPSLLAYVEWMEEQGTQKHNPWR